MMGLLRQVQGWVKLKGATDGTKIGNVNDALKVVTTVGTPVDAPPIVYLSVGQVKNVEAVAGEITLEANKRYGNITCQTINARDSLWRLAWVENAGGVETIHTIGYGYTGSGNPTDMIFPSVSSFLTTAVGAQKLRIYMTPLDNANTAYVNLSVSKIS